MFQQKGASVLLSHFKVQGTDLRYGCMQVMAQTSGLAACRCWKELFVLLSVSQQLCLLWRWLYSQAVLGFFLPCGWYSQGKEGFFIYESSRSPRTQSDETIQWPTLNPYCIQGDGRRSFGRPESQAHFAPKKRGGIKVSPTQPHRPSTRKDLFKGAAKEGEMGA